MQLSIIFVIIVISFVVLLNNGIYGHNIDFPVEACMSGLATGNYQMCVTQLAHSIIKLHKWSEDTPINICEISCMGNLKGRISKWKWKWKWDGRFRCDSDAPGVVGHASRQSRPGAMEWAVKDFLDKAIGSGRLKPEQFQC